MCLSDRIQREEDCDDPRCTHVRLHCLLSDRIQREEDCDTSTRLWIVAKRLFQTVSRGKRIATIFDTQKYVSSIQLSDRIQREEDCDCQTSKSKFQRKDCFQTVSRGKRIATNNNASLSNVSAFLSDRIQREEDCDCCNLDGSEP